MYVCMYVCMYACMYVCIYIQWVYMINPSYCSSIVDNKVDNTCKYLIVFVHYQLND